MPEWRQFEIGISIRRYFPPIGTAGFERYLVRGKSLLPFAVYRLIAGALIWTFL